MNVDITLPDYAIDNVISNSDEQQSSMCTHSIVLRTTCSLDQESRKKPRVAHMES
jgi:hypothetical protein